MQYALEYLFDATHTRLYSCRMSIAERLNEAMQEAGFGTNQSALHRASGVPQPTINRILKGVTKKSPETETIRKLAAACNVSFEWLNEGIGPRKRGYIANPDFGLIATKTAVRAVEDGEQNQDIVHIRKVKLNLSAGIVGFSIEPEVEDANPIYFRKEWFLGRGYSAEKLIAIRVKGQSMEPGLYEGDTVVINTADITPRDGEVFAVNYEGEDVIKRLVRDGGQWWLSSDNPDQRRYPRKECGGDMCIIIGRVVHKQSERI